MEALAAFWDGAFGSSYAILSATLVRATPLLLLGLAVAVAFRAGVLNIGTDGQFLAGASAATAAALALEGWPRAIALGLSAAAGLAAGAAWASVAAWLRRRFGVLEVISTLMLNFIAAAGVSWLVRGPMQEPTRVYPQSAMIPESTRWPLLFEGHRLHAGFLVGLLTAIAAWYVLTRTALGFRLRLVGVGPRAAASAGQVDVAAVSWRVFLASGAIAGLAGASEVGGVTWSLYEGLSPGYGYAAIAAALLARLDPRWVVGTAILLGALEAGAAAMQRQANVPSVVGQVVVALLVIGVLIAQVLRPRRRVATTAPTTAVATEGTR
jgi:simple sugar transport system permease protein